MSSSQNRPHGSSPRARGTQSPSVSETRAPRFIPACAGNARSWWKTRDGPPVHPRVRGERDGVCSDTRALDGSSPRARGTLWSESEARDRGRFIPACAGNARPRRGLSAPKPVHPRVRGERCHRSSSNSNAARFIPACAGNALSDAVPSGWATVHPRVRGERDVARSEDGRVFGSSPRARGTHS